MGQYIKFDKIIVLIRSLTLHFALKGNWSCGIDKNMFFPLNLGCTEYMPSTKRFASFYTVVRGNEHHFSRGSKYWWQGHFFCCIHKYPFYTQPNTEMLKKKNVCPLGLHLLRIFFKQVTIENILWNRQGRFLTYFSLVLFFYSVTAECRLLCCML